MIRMRIKTDITALGELLIDFTPAGVSQQGMRLFEQNPGGAPANLLTVASHMGYSTAFIGKVGADMHGAFLKKTLEKEGIRILNIKSFRADIVYLNLLSNHKRKNFSFQALAYQKAL